MIKIFTSFFGAGWLPKFPGTWGSIAAIPFAYILHILGGALWIAIACVICFLLGWWATKLQTQNSDDHDPSEIVIDEVVGQWLAILPLSYLFEIASKNAFLLPFPGVITAFILFRLFDIWKPWPVSWADNMDTPLGVMLDDVIAGIMAGVGVVAIGWSFHALLT